jgi:hypothetical protein
MSRLPAPARASLPAATGARAAFLTLLPTRAPPCPPRALPHACIQPTRTVRWLPARLLQGGDVVPTLAVHDTVKHMRSQVGTVAFGGAMAMAGFLLAIGAKARMPV